MTRRTPIRSKLVREHARGKARSVGSHEECPVLGVDTAVVVDGRSLGKPGNATEAEAMLERLSGRTHEVVSGPLPGHAWLGRAPPRGDGGHVPSADGP